MLGALEQAVERGLIGEGARWLASADTGPAPNLPQIANLATSEILARFVNNFKNMCERLRTGETPSADPLAPEIVFYEDQARIRPADRTEGLTIHLMKVVRALQKIYALALLNEEPAVSFQSIGKSYVAGLKDLHFVAGAKENWEDLYRLTWQMFNRSTMMRLFGKFWLKSLFLVD
jgi:hypothetical protein